MKSIALGALALMLGLAALPALSKPVSISIYTAHEHQINKIIEVVGHVESLQTPVVSSEVSGEVLQLLVKLGDKVGVGSELAVIDDENYQLAILESVADIERYAAMTTMQAQQTKRYASLLRKRQVNRAIYDKARSELKSLQAQQRAAQARYDRNQNLLRKTTIKSPVSGYVDERMISVGDYAQPGKPLFKLIDNRRLRAKLPISEKFFSQLKIGQTVYLENPFYEVEPLQSNIHYLRPKIDPDTGSVQAFSVFENPSIESHEPVWKAGSTVRARIVLQTENQAVMVPTQALVQRPEGDVVYVVYRNYVKAHKVVTGIIENGMIEIIQGLSPGRVIAVDGARFLTEGAEVLIVKTLKDESLFLPGEL
ncbi:MAG: efflux RND transporter periplasmic adaptor subunit [Pseudomonadota bacterium]